MIYMIYLLPGKGTKPSHTKTCDQGVTLLSSSYGDWLGWVILHKWLEVVLRYLCVGNNKWNITCTL